MSEHPYRDGLPPAPPGPPEGEQHRLMAAAPVLSGLALGPAAPLALVLAGTDDRVAAVALVLAGLLAVLLPWMRALGERERFVAERGREEAEIRDWPERERWEVAAVLHRYGLRGDVLARAVEQVAAEPRRWVDFMMRFELDLVEPHPARAMRESLLLGTGVLAGGGAVLAAAAGGPVPAAGVGFALAAVAAALAGRARGERGVLAACRGLVPPAAAVLAAILLRAS